MGEIMIGGKWNGEKIPQPFVISERLHVDKLKADSPNMIESNYSLFAKFRMIFFLQKRTKSSQFEQTGDIKFNNSVKIS